MREYGTRTTLVFLPADNAVPQIMLSPIYAVPQKTLDTTLSDTPLVLIQNKRQNCRLRRSPLLSQTYSEPYQTSKITAETK